MKHLINKYILSIVLLLSSLAVSAQVAEFEKYAKAEGTTYACISKAMFNLIGGKASASVPNMDMAQLVGKINSMQIINCESERACKSIKDDVAKIVKTKRYDMLMQTSEAGSEVKIYINEGQKTSVLILISDSASTVTCVVIAGSFSTKGILNAIETNTKK